MIQEDEEGGTVVLILGTLLHPTHLTLRTISQQGGEGDHLGGRQMICGT